MTGVQNVSTTNHTETTTHHTADSMDNMEHHHEEYMNPFLPDLDNDTVWHPEHHLVDHNLVPTDQDSSENVSTFKPSLEFDQLNHTNPLDNVTSDEFRVIPLKPNMVNESKTIEKILENVSSTESKF